MSLRPSQAPEIAFTPSLGVRALGGFGTSIAGGAALGALAWTTDELGFPWGALLPFNSIGVWLAAAFALGASARTLPTGALRGVIGLVAAVVAYYALHSILGAGFRVIGASHAATVWGSVALLAGPVFGLAGAAWRHEHGWPRAIGVAALSAALIAEGLVFGAGRLVLVSQLATDPGTLLLAVEVAIGVVLPWVLLRPAERRVGYASVVVLAVAAAIAIGPLTSLLRGLADRF